MNSIFIFLFFLILLFIIIRMFIRCQQVYYFDNNATTTYIKPEIKDTICKWLDCGNPSNTLYKLGQDAAYHNYKAREIIANDLQVDPTEIYFTSNATESNNIAIQSIINYYLDHNTLDIYTIMCSNIEHPSVLEIFKHYKNNPRINVVFIPIDNNINSEFYGSINPYNLEKLIKQQKNRIILLSAMFANNETGAINPVKTIGDICKNYNIVFHCDATQAIGKYIIRPEELGIHALTFSGHKIHAPKGVGCLYLKNQILLNSKIIKKCNIETKNLYGVCFGGEQTIIRPGTENVAFNIALAMALEDIHKDRIKKNQKMLYLKNYLWHHLKNMNCELINPKHCMPNTLLIIVNSINCCNKVFARDLATNYGVCVGTSSACQTSKTNSHVVAAMNIPEKKREHIIRISMCDYTTKSDCKHLLDGFYHTIQKHKIIKN